MTKELNTLAPKKWVDDYSGVPPTIDITDAVRIGDYAIDNITSEMWQCIDNETITLNWMPILNPSFDTITVASSASFFNNTFVGIASGAADNDKFATQGYVNDNGASTNDLRIAYVATNGNDATGAIYDSFKPFLTIQAAINALEAVVAATDIATVIVGCGTYVGDITVTNKIIVRVEGGVIITGGTITSNDRLYLQGAVFYNMVYAGTGEIRFMLGGIMQQVSTLTHTRTGPFRFSNGGYMYLLAATDLNGSIEVLDLSSLQGTSFLANAVNGAYYDVDQGKAVNEALVTVTTASSDITLTKTSAKEQIIDPNGADRIITLPTAFRGGTFRLANSGSADTITVDMTIDVVLAPGESCKLSSDGITWYVVDKVTVSTPSAGGGLTWKVVTANVTAVSNDGIFVDASSNIVTILLPTTPTLDDKVGIRMLDGTNTVEIDGNGVKIEGSLTNLVMDVANSSFELVYSGATYGWVIVTEVSSGTLLTDIPWTNQVAISNETDVLTTGVKVTYPNVGASTLTEVRAYIAVVGTTSGVTTIDIKQNGTSILSTLLTIDFGDKTSVGATVPAVISTAGLIDNAEMTIEITTLSGGATEANCKIQFIGTEAI